MSSLRSSPSRLPGSGLRGRWSLSLNTSRVLLPRSSDTFVYPLNRSGRKFFRDDRLSSFGSPVTESASLLTPASAAV